MRPLFTSQLGDLLGLLASVLSFVFLFLMICYCQFSSSDLPFSALRLESLVWRTLAAGLVIASANRLS